MPERDPIETLRQIAQFAGEAKRLGEDGSRELIERDLRYLRAAERVVELIGGRPLAWRRSCAIVTRRCRGARSLRCATD